MSKIIRLTENQFGEMMAYHGSGSDFDKFNHKKYLSTGAGSQSFGWGTYVTDDKSIANGYVDASKKNPAKNFIVNYDIRSYLESLGKYDDLMISEILGYFKNYVVYIFKESMNPTFEKAENSLKDLIKFDTDQLNCYLPLDKVIELYNSSDFDHMSEEEKEAEIRKHAEIIKRIERPIIALNACLDALYHLKPELEKYINNKKDYFYEVEIPDDNGFNYLSWYDEPTNEQQKAITDGIHNLERRYNTNLVRDYVYDFIFESGSSVYKTLCDTFLRFVEMSGRQSYKAASLFLMQCGFDGIKYPAGTRWQKPEGAAEDAMNYVIFDANKVKIINKTQT